MAPAAKVRQYPWGTIPPRQRLSHVSEKATKALDHAKAPGFGQVASHVTVSVQASRPLVEILQYLAGSGLRATSSEEKPLPCDAVNDAVQQVNQAVSELASSSVLTLSERYAAFAESVTALAALGAEASRRGVARPVAKSVEDGWATFET